MVFLRVKSYQEEQSINKTKIPIFCSNVIWYFWNTTTISVFRKDSKSLRNKANKNEGKSIPYRTPILSEK